MSARATLLIAILAAAGCAPFQVTQQLRGTTAPKHYIYPPGSHPNAAIRATVRLDQDPAPICAGVPFDSDHFVLTLRRHALFSPAVAVVRDKGTVPASKEDFDNDMKKLWANANANARACAPAARDALANALWERMPRSFADDLLSRYGLHAADRYVDLHPGMRLRIDWQTYVDAKKELGFVGTGSSYFVIGQRPDQSTLTFEPFFGWMPVEVRRPQSSHLFATLAGSIDVEGEELRRKRFRLAYSLGKSGDSREPTTNITDHAALIGADNEQALERATTAFQVDGECPIEVAAGGTVCTRLASRSVAIPEIRIRAGGQSEYVSLGTTVRQLLARDGIEPSGRQQLPLRRRHHGRWRNVVIAGPFGDSVFDLPVVQGDDVR